MRKISDNQAEKMSAVFADTAAQELIESTTKAADADTGSFRVVITTEDLDRYNEVIKMEGWELNHYRSNPVVLWGHDHSRIIGVATDIRIENNQMIAEGKFAPTEEGQEKRKLYEQGFLKATSVGFIEKEREGNIVTKAELIEFSFVSVPANPYALSLALEHERSIDELVTKGIFTIEKDTQKDTQATEAHRVKDTDTAAITDEHITKIAEATALAVTRAWEAAQESEPEGTEGEADPVEREFQLKRALQGAATLLGDDLAKRKAKRLSSN